MNALDIKKFREDNNLSQSQLAEYLGTSVRAVQSWEQGIRNISQSSVKLLMSYGKMPHVSEVTPVYGFPYMLVPFVPISARAGYLRGFGDQEYIDALSTLPAIVDKTYRGKYRIFEVEGDSMEDGSFRSIMDKDKVLGREVVREHWRNKLHYNDWFFIIVHQSEGILIKEITEHNVGTGDIKCHSLNNLFDDFYLNLNEVSELYSVVKVVERNVRK